MVALIVVFLAAELGIRLIERHLSIDIAHIRDAPRVATEIAKANGRQKVLVIGNSSARAGIDPKVLRDRLSSGGMGDADIQFFYPDGGNIGDWRWGWRRYFAPPLKQPDLVLICGSKSHFDDASVNAINAANYFVAKGDVATYVWSELRTLEERLSFVVASVSVSYANRQRTQRRFLDLFLPYNRQVLGEVADNAARKAVAEGRVRQGDGSTRLSALLQDLRLAHTRVAVVAMPASSPYAVPASRVAVVAAAGAQWIDLRAVPGIVSGDFYDGAHLNHEGAVKLTAALAEALAKALLP